MNYHQSYSSQRRLDEFFSPSSQSMYDVIQSSFKHESAKPLEESEMEKLREAYDEIIKKRDRKKQFEDVATLLLRDLEDGDMLVKSEASTEPISLAADGRLYEFSDKYCVLAGRLPECDVLLASATASRVHFILFMFPQFDKYLVVDVGSVNGITTQQRSNSQLPLANSLPNARQILIFSWGEIAILGLGNQRIAINPKVCVICFERPREVTFEQCNHYVCCLKCARSLPNCPLCRTEVRAPSMREFGMFTQINRYH